MDGTTGAVHVLRHHDIEQLAHDPHLAGIGLALFDLLGIGSGPLRDWYGGLMFTNEGPAHNRLRALVSRAFTPRAVEALRAQAAALATKDLALIAADGGGDLVDALGLLPMRVMCRLLGVPDDDVVVFGDWTDALSPTFGFMTPEQIESASSAITELLAYVEALADRRHDDPGDDLMSGLIAAEEDGERLTHAELVAMVANLLVGGHDTTASQIGCTMLTLVRHPDQASRLHDDASLIHSAVAETIRFEPSIAAVPRTTTAPMQVADVEVGAGALLLLSTAAANREEGIWRDPDVVDFGRFAEPHAPRLLSFGAGPHYCLGAALARLTIEEAVRATVDLGPALEPARDPWQVPWRSLLGRAPATLPVTIS